MNHRIINHGPHHIVVCDTSYGLHKIETGESAIIDFISICHGDGRAHYSVEPMPEPPKDAAEVNNKQLMKSILRRYKD